MDEPLCILTTASVQTCHDGRRKKGMAKRRGIVGMDGKAKHGRKGGGVKEQNKGAKIY